MGVAAQGRAVAAVTLVLRVITLGLLAASIAVIARLARTRYDLVHVNIVGNHVPDKYITGVVPREVIDFSFQNLYTYRYVFSVAVIGCAYTLILIPLALIDTIQGTRIGGTLAAWIIIFTDVVFCTLFISGGAAGLGLVVDNQRSNGKLFNSSQRKFYISFDVSCGLLLAAAICTVVMIMISVYSK